jgi:hypothetical protein
MYSIVKNIYGGYSVKRADGSIVIWFTTLDAAERFVKARIERVYKLLGA